MLNILFENIDRIFLDESHIEVLTVLLYSMFMSYCIAAFVPKYCVATCTCTCTDLIYTL